jgi:hypothetical protein
VAIPYLEAHPKTWPLPLRRPCYPRRSPQSAKTLRWHGLSDSLAMSPLAHHARHTARHNLTVRVSHRICARRRLTVGTAPTRAAKDFVFFAPSQTTVLRCKTRRYWLCLWRPYRATMSPLRAVGSRGHIALRDQGRRPDKILMALAQIRQGNGLKVPDTKRSDAISF